MSDTQGVGLIDDTESGSSQDRTFFHSPSQGLLSIPSENSDKLQDAVPDAKQLPTPREGETLVKLADGTPRIVPTALLDKVTEVDPASVPVAHGTDGGVLLASAPDIPAKRPVMPRLAGPRDYLDTPDTLTDLGTLYKNSSLSFMQSDSSSYGERLVPIDQKGRLGDVTLGSTEKDTKGQMHAKASIPTDSQAIIHTHVHGLRPEPSQEDYDTAKKIGKPNFVMSRDAIYVAMPDGDVKHPVKVADISPAKGGKLTVKWN